MDNEGTWIKCCATGENAKSPAIQSSVEVIIFCATALEPLNTPTGYLYVTKDSTIVPVSRMSPTHKQAEWTIRARPSASVA